jgi:hypothetical protein
MATGLLRFLRGNTIALLALFIALGGTTYAATALPKNSVGPKQLKKNAVTNPKIANGAVTGAKIANNSVKGADVLESSLGKVPSAATADAATTATNATHATSAASAPPSGPAGGDLAGTYPNATLRPPEAWHEVGGTGEPGFENAWVNYGPCCNTAGFYKDRFGLIHLKGLVKTGAIGSTIFTLPAGYRSPLELLLPTVSNNAFGEIVTYPDGRVVANAGSNAFISLDAIVFPST